MFLILLYIDQEVYLLQNPECKLPVSIGLIQGIYKDKQYIFKHTCITKLVSFGSQILKLNTNKIIGIHKSRT